MANECFTQVRILGEKKEISEVYDMLHGLEESGKNWLGDIVNALGGNTDEVYCRGDFENVEPISETEIGLDERSAWRPMVEVWNFLQSIYDVEIYWIAEEGGCGYYATNDAEGKVFSERYEVYLGDSTEYFDTMEDVLKYANKLFNTNGLTEDLLMKIIDGSDHEYRLNEYEVVDYDGY
jgi:hypothetical protein